MNNRDLFDLKNTIIFFYIQNNNISLFLLFASINLLIKIFHFLHILHLVKEGLILFFAISVISFLECVYQGEGSFSWTYIVAVVLVKTFVTSSVKLVWAVDVS